MFLTAYLAVCLLVGFLGRKRGLGFLAYFLLSIVITPLITLLILLLTRPSSESVHAAAAGAGGGRVTCGRCNHALKHLRAIEYCTHCGQPL